MTLTSGSFKDQLWIVGLNRFCKEESRGKKEVTEMEHRLYLSLRRKRGSWGQKEKSMDFCTRLALLRVKTN